MQPVQHAVQAALRDLQAALGSSSGDSSVASREACSHAVGQLAACLQAPLQQHSSVVEAVETRATAVQALRSALASKEAEAARLQGEVSRLRSATGTLASQPRQQQGHCPCCSEENEDGVAAGTALEPAARKAVLDASQAAKDKPTAILHHLHSEVSARQARIAALEAELAAAAADHASRLSAQQQAFLAKLEQLRQVHSQQLQAAAHDTQEAEARCSSLERQLSEAGARQAQQQDTIASLRGQLERCRQQQQQHYEAASSAIQPAAAPAPVEIDSKLDAGTAAATAFEVAALQQMEAQLARLSSQLKAHQAERDQLRQTLLSGVGERQALQAQVAQLSARLEQQQAGAGRA